MKAKEKTTFHHCLDGWHLDEKKYVKIKKRFLSPVLGMFMTEEGIFPWEGSHAANRQTRPDCQRRDETMSRSSARRNPSRLTKSFTWEEKYVFFLFLPA